MYLYETFELEFQGEPPKGSQAAIDFSLKYQVYDEKNQIIMEHEVPGFYAGDGTYKVRILPEHTGRYYWRTSGCIQKEGIIECICNPEEKSRSRGLVRAEKTHFTYQDGTYYQPFGTTVYALIHQEQSLIDQTIQTLHNAPFNKVRYCVFPKHYDFNQNEPQYYPFEKDEHGNWDVDRPCFAYWDHLESILFTLQEMGIQSDLILFHPYDRWGFSKLTMEQNKCYVHYLLSRLAAVPGVWWSMANEYDLFFDWTLEDWYEIEAYITQHDPYHHLISNHNCLKYYDFSRPAITHCCVQTAQLEKAADWIRQYEKPLIYDECCYEGNLPHNWGNISGYEMVNRFWLAFVQGAYCTHGEVFLSEDDVLWWSKGGTLKGTSPERIAFLRNIAEELPGPVEAFDLQEYIHRDDPPEMKAEKNDFWRLYDTLTQAQKDVLILKDGDFRGHIGEAVFLQYFAHHCPGIMTWPLPENRAYQIEVIDVWKMTRQVVMTGASGEVTIKLPGKTGIAVLIREM